MEKRKEQLEKTMDAIKDGLMNEDILKPEELDSVEGGDCFVGCNSGCFWSKMNGGGGDSPLPDDDTPIDPIDPIDPEDPDTDL